MNCKVLEFLLKRSFLFIMWWILLLIPTIDLRSINTLYSLALNNTFLFLQTQNCNTCSFTTQMQARSYGVRSPTQKFVFALLKKSFKVVPNIMWKCPLNKRTRYFLKQYYFDRLYSHILASFFCISVNIFGPPKTVLPLQILHPSYVPSQMAIYVSF